MVHLMALEILILFLLHTYLAVIIPKDYSFGYRMSQRIHSYFYFIAYTFFQQSLLYL